jgi:hypothetical protein
MALGIVTILAILGLVDGAETIRLSIESSAGSCAIFFRIAGGLGQNKTKIVPW